MWDEEEEKKAKGEEVRPKKEAATLLGFRVSGLGTLTLPQRSPPVAARVSLQGVSRDDWFSEESWAPGSRISEV